MATSSNNTFELKKDGYVAFDAMSLRQLIINRLNEQKVFTDQNYLGSNLASIIDIVSYAFHTLIYYLNKTSSESMFTEAELYENINRIVKLIDYSPVGFQTSTLSFNCSATNLNQGLYTIPRYSLGFINNIPFSFNEDIIFAKQQDQVTENLEQLSLQKFLYQGVFQEYPTYTATGEENEIIILNSNNDLVDHFNIDIYVKSITTNTWEQYSRTANLFLENNFAKKYEIRLNQNNRYEIKFGNNINGKKLEAGDQVAIYYLASLGDQGVVGATALNENSFLVPYSTVRYREILSDISSRDNVFFMSAQDIGNLVFTNTFDSTLPKQPETVNEIKSRAPAHYRSQNRLVTTADFENFINNNFSNLITDVKCVNNWRYVSEYLKYFYDIGLNDPQQIDQPLFNQLQYADSCNFNNIYILVVPRYSSTTPTYLQPSQKQLINSSLLDNKMATVETVFMDPVYKAVTIGITNSVTSLDPELESSLSELQIVKDSLSRRNDQSIMNDVINVFTNYFINNRFEQTVDIRLLTQQILGIEGVRTFFTVRTDDPTIRTEGLSVFVYNPVYPIADNLSSTTNVPLKYFEYMYFTDFLNLVSKIKIISPALAFESKEY